ncbi:glycoside hydrolase family 105 protein [Pseudoalteromonas sp. BSi20495]|uniref:glycoside hydrolase family 88/105 protein n=1 Tax=Pseudoalteromonas sp. BSi20495 TaxID=386429 RepID=UPI00023160E8|nr:glycoside hydrolase family 88 protein [Pseudoalteromonas sp. BSi20495]GAA78409.1 unsaturated rhamnogalacturonyl hydrolase yteR [Pseudoalteromonas sp. BSi20495]
MHLPFSSAVFSVLICIFCCVFTLKAEPLPNENLWSIRMAESEMQRNPQAYTLDWRKAPRWDYTHGLELLAFSRLYQNTKDKRYFDYIREYVDSLINEDGTIKSYQQSKYNIDMLNAGKLLFFMYDETKNNKYRLAIDTLYKQLEHHPRTKEGGFWHKKRYTSQMWLDGLYMGAPFYAQYIRRYGSETQFDDVIKQFELIEKYLYRSDTKLPVHGWDESKQQAWANPKTGQSPNHWSRSIGWYAMAMVDVLDQLPNNYNKKTWLNTRFKALIDAALIYQDSSGTWFQVTDKASIRGNYLESSGSAMLTYAMAQGVMNGYLPADYLLHAQRSYNGLIKQFILVDATNQRISFTQTCAVAGLGGTPYRDGSFGYYISEDIRANDPKGVGPFILASLALMR